MTAQQGYILVNEEYITTQTPTQRTKHAPSVREGGRVKPEVASADRDAPETVQSMFALCYNGMVSMSTARVRPDALTFSARGAVDTLWAVAWSARRQRIHGMPRLHCKMPAPGGTRHLAGMPSLMLVNGSNVV
jgi:hypothetical protein